MSSNNDQEFLKKFIDFVSKFDDMNDIFSEEITEFGNTGNREDVEILDYNETVWCEHMGIMGQSAHADQGNFSYMNI